MLKAFARLIAKVLPDGRPFWEQRRFSPGYPVACCEGDTIFYGERSRKVTRAIVLRSRSELRDFVLGG